MAVSDDGLHLAYEVALPNGDKALYVDGRETGPFDDIVDTSLRFSPDGTRIAFVEVDGDGVRMVVDGEKGRTFEAIPFDSAVFSPDGQRFAYAGRIKRETLREAEDGTPAAIEEEWSVILDGQELGRFEDVAAHGLTFSPDSQRLAYVVEEDSGWTVIVDGTRSRYWGAIAGRDDPAVVFDGPDRIHYMTITGRDVFLVEEQIE